MFKIFLNINIRKKKILGTPGTTFYSVQDIDGSDRVRGHATDPCCMKRLANAIKSTPLRIRQTRRRNQKLIKVMQKPIEDKYIIDEDMIFPEETSTSC